MSPWQVLAWKAAEHASTFTTPCCQTMPEHAVDAVHSTAAPRARGRVG
jgi:hypothetical protein